jgi:hypothetical protein
MPVRGFCEPTQGSRQEVIMEVKDYIDVVRQVWAASKDNFRTWLAMLTEPHTVIAEWPSDSYDGVVKAAEFSIFPVLLSMALGIPLSVFAGVTAANSWIIDFVTYYIQAFIWSLSLWLVGRAALGKGSFLICLTANLLFTAYWPVNKLIAYMLYEDKLLMCARLTSSYTSDVTAHLNYRISAWASIVFAVFLVFQTSKVIKQVHKVGTARAVAVAIAFGLVGIEVSDYILKPISLAIYKSCS